MTRPAQVLSYRPYFNRHRVVYILHHRPDDAEYIAGAFIEQGFMVSTAATVDALFRLMALHKPDVVMLELETLQQQPDLIDMLQSLAFGARVFALADMSPQTFDIVRAVRSGAVSVFAKPFQVTEMISAVVDELRADIRTDGGYGVAVEGKSSLTTRELQVLQHIVQGDTNKQTALALGISPRTVEVHRAAAMRKLGARNTAEMIRIALKG